MKALIMCIFIMVGAALEAVLFGVRGLFYYIKLTDQY